MRLANVPITFGLLALAGASVVVGFPGGLLWALPVYVVALVASLGVKGRVIARLGYFDNVWPLPVAIAHFARPKFAGPLTLILGLMGWGVGLASVYLFLRLWLWFPDELPILPGIPFVGALITVSALWVADIVLEGIISLALFGRRPP